MTKRCVLGLAVLLLSSSTARAGKTDGLGPVLGTGPRVLLRLRLEEGKVYQMLQVIEQKIVQEMMGRKISTDQKMGFGFSFKITKVEPDGAMTADARYESILFKVKGAAGAVEYDSTKPPAEIPPAARGFAALVGEGFSLTFTSTGHVTAVSGINKMIDKVFRDVGVAEKATKDALKAQMGDKAMKEMMEKMMAIYPDKPVGVGDVWRKDVAMGGMIGMNVANTYKLTRRKEGVTTLTVSSKITPNADNKPLDVGGMKISSKLRGSQKGTMQIDERTGWIRQSKVVQDVSGTMRMQMPNAKQPMEIPIEIKSVIRLGAAK